LRPYVTLDTWIIMPNHVHIIFYLDDPAFRNNTPDRPVVGAWRAMPLPDDTSGIRQFSKPIAGSLSTIIGSFKSAVTKRINESRGAGGEPIWQRNFHEHIIRKPDELDRIRSYILRNPRTWLTDDEYDE
jgi:putative transposase